MLRLTLLRKQNGWTKMELARRAKMHPADVGKIEAGLCVPYPGHLARLTEVFGLGSAASVLLLEKLPDDETTVRVPPISVQQQQQTHASDDFFADGLVTVAAAAAFLSLSRSAVYTLMERGDLVYVKLGRARRIPKRALSKLSVSFFVGKTTK